MDLYIHNIYVFLCIYMYIYIYINKAIYSHESKYKSKMSGSFKCKFNDPCAGSGVTGRQTESSVAVFSIVN